MKQTNSDIREAPCGASFITYGKAYYNTDVRSNTGFSNFTTAK